MIRKLLSILLLAVVPFYAAGQVVEFKTPSPIDSILPLTRATTVQSQVVEAGTLAYSGSPTATLANFTSGPGIMTRFGFIASVGNGYNSTGIKNLIFQICVDGEQPPCSVILDGDFWGASGLIKTPQGGSPYVWDADHLGLLYGYDAGGNAYSYQFIFKYPVPFRTGLRVFVQNPSYGATFVRPYWSAVDVQMGLSSPRRLKSDTTLSNSGSSLVWSSGTTYSAGQFAKYTDGFLYVNILSSLGSGQAPGNTTYWQKVAKAAQVIPVAPAWSNSFTYSAGNLVTQGGALYSAVDSSLNSQPPSAHWTATTTAANPNFETGYVITSIPRPAWIAHYGFGSQGCTGTNCSGTVSFLETNLAVYDNNLSPADSYPGNSPTPLYNSSGTEDFMLGSFYWATLGPPFSSASIDAAATALTVTSTSGSGTQASLTVPTMGTLDIPQPPTNSWITVQGCSITGYNGTYQVKNGTNTTTIVYTNTTTGAATGCVVNLPAVHQLHGRTGSLRYGYSTAISSPFAAAANVDFLSVMGGIKCSISCLLRFEQGGNAAGTGPTANGMTFTLNPTVLWYQ